jgi:hypothetical protein
MKTDIIKNLHFGVTQRSLTTRNIAEALLVIMQSHIGNENAILREDLFKKLFRHDYNDSNLRDWLRWEFVKRAMHFCRVFTNCFIGCKSINGNFSYFVLKSMDDAQFYHDMLENSIKKMRIMQKRAILSVRGEWYKDKWLIPEKKVRQIA